MNNLDDFHGASSGRRRLAELREKRRGSVADSISRSRVTVIINLVIEFASACIFLVGLIIIVKIMGIRKDGMTPGSFRLYSGVVAVIVLVWFALLANRIRGKIRLIREVFGKKPEHLPPA